MLDLNVEIISSDQLPFGDEKVLVVAKEEDRDVEEEEEKAKQLIGGAGGGGRGRREEEEEEEGEEEQHSVGTSDSSSVVNDEESLASAGDENSSSAAPVAFVFDVFKKDQDESIPRPDQLATRQLFPVPEGGEAELGHEPIAAVTAPRTQWLKLSSAGSGCRESGGPLMTGKLKSLQPQKQKQQQQVRKSRRGPRSRSSQYRGVTFYRRTGRWESHIWDCGKQVYLGGFDTAYAAARAYDRAAIKFRGADADINFSISDYEEDMKQMGNLTKEEFIHVLRRQGTGVSRGNPKSRGMGLQKCGPWDARMGQFIGAHGIVDSQYNSREAIADLRHAGYECEVALEASHEGSGGGHHLDLNLGMAPPSAGDPKKIKVVGNYRASSRDWKARGGELPMVGCSDISASNKRPPVWPAMYPFLLPSSEGKAVEKKRRAEAPTSSNIGWQMGINGNHGGTSTSPSMPLVFSSNAASSGFSPSSSSSSSSSARHLHHISAAPQNPNSQLLMKPSSNNVNPFPFYRFRV